LKKIQRLNERHPSLFPKVLNVSYEDNQAYFDIDYCEGFRDIKTILTEESLSHEQIENISSAMWLALDQIHTKKYKYNHGSLYLYYIEEILQKLNDANKYKEFLDFSQNQEYIYLGNKVKNLSYYLSDIESFFKSSVLNSEENIHGNPTLENTLYSLEENRIIFIDPYEESIVDTKLLDYSMVLQCSHSYYSFLNDKEVVVTGNEVTHSNTIPENLKTFNNFFEAQLKQKIDNIKLVELFEASQFIRMLPFKCAAGNIEKAKFFYAHACYLIERVFNK
jgi:hypothetical protein